MEDVIAIPQTPQHNTAQDNVTMIPATELISLHWQEMPVNTDFIDDLGNEIIQWALHSEDEPTSLLEFYHLKGIYSKDVWTLTQKYPSFDRAHKQAKEIIGVRREKGALTRRYDAATVRWGQHSYGPEWQRYDEHHAHLRQAQEKRDERITIVVQQPETSELVEAKQAKDKANKAVKTKAKSPSP